MRLSIPGRRGEQYPDLPSDHERYPPELNQLPSRRRKRKLVAVRETSGRSLAASPMCICHPLSTPANASAPMPYARRR